MGGSPGEASLPIKVAAGMTTGGLAISIASPTDLVKVSWGLLMPTVALASSAFHLGVLTLLSLQLPIHSTAMHGMPLHQ